MCDAISAIAELAGVVGGVRWRCQVSGDRASEMAVAGRLAVSGDKGVRNGGVGWRRRVREKVEVGELSR